MTRTPEQRALWERQCYGCTEADLDRTLERSIGGGIMLAMSILSDAQEIIAADNNRENGGDVSEADANIARQYINRAKYLLNGYRKQERELREFLPQLGNTLQQMQGLSFFKNQAD